MSRQQTADSPNDNKGTTIQPCATMSLPWCYHGVSQGVLSEQLEQRCHAVTQQHAQIPHRQGDLFIQHTKQYNENIGTRLFLLVLVLVLLLLSSDMKTRDQAPVLPADLSSTEFRHLSSTAPHDWSIIVHVHHVITGTKAPRYHPTQIAKLLSHSPPT